MPLDLPDVDPPLEVVLDRAAGLRLRWPDGTESRFASETLRRNCPCAECRGLREQGIVPGSADPHPVGAELVGAWGVSLEWDDGHATGIYAWSILKQWAALEE
jgi:DUF971 family protein